MIDNLNLLYLGIVGIFLAACIFLVFWNRARENAEQMYASEKAAAEKSARPTGPPALPKQSLSDAAAEERNHPKMWHYSIDGRSQYGPIPEEELRHLLDSRRLLPDTLVWTRELPCWNEASSCKLLMNAQEAS